MNVIVKQCIYMSTNNTRTMTRMIVTYSGAPPLPLMRLITMATPLCYMCILMLLYKIWCCSCLPVHIRHAVIASP